MSNRSESNPEKYLREIRDLQLQNLEILKKLTEFEDEKKSVRKWSTGIKVIGSLMPYLLSIALVWSFYTKIEDLTISVTDTVKNLPQTLSIDIGGKWNDVKESGKNLWENKNKISEKWEEFNQ